MRAVLAASAAVALAAVSTAGCGGGGSDLSDLENTPWVLTSGKGITLAAGVAPGAVFLEDGSVSGSSGCNRFQGSYTVDGDSLAIGPIAATLKACPPLRDAIEKAYFAALGQVAGWAVEGGALVLSDGDGSELLRYEVATLVGAWKVTGLLSGDALSSPIAGTKVTATFGEDGLLVGSGGCNQYRTAYTTDAGKISIGQAASTKKLCSEPAGVMEQEAAYLAALQEAKRYGLDGTTAELGSADGRRLVTLDRVQP